MTIDKAALVALVEKWRVAVDASPRTDCGDLWASGVEQCADELAAILAHETVGDAEVLKHDEREEQFAHFYHQHCGRGGLVLESITYALNKIDRLRTITDADVERACEAYWGNLWDGKDAGKSTGARICMRAALQSYAQSRGAVGDGWQTIATAPNDGTMHARGLHVFSSEDGRFLYWDAIVGHIDTEDGLFYDQGGDVCGWDSDDFTHWHSLAAAPQPETRG